eukprot:RCo033247
MLASYPPRQVVYVDEPVHREHFLQSQPPLPLNEVVMLDNYVYTPVVHTVQVSYPIEPPVAGMGLHSAWRGIHNDENIPVARAPDRVSLHQSDKTYTQKKASQVLFEESQTDPPAIGIQASRQPLWGIPAPPKDFSNYYGGFVTAAPAAARFLPSTSAPEVILHEKPAAHSIPTNAPTTAVADAVQCDERNASPARPFSYAAGKEVAYTPSPQPQLQPQQQQQQQQQQMPRRPSP